MVAPPRLAYSAVVGGRRYQLDEDHRMMRETQGSGATDSTPGQDGEDAK